MHIRGISGGNGEYKKLNKNSRTKSIINKIKYWLNVFNSRLEITKERVSKLGDQLIEHRPVG